MMTDLFTELRLTPRKFYPSRPQVDVLWVYWALHTEGSTDASVELKAHAGIKRLI